MNANYAEICRVGKLETEFPQVPPVQFFSNFQYIIVKHNNSNSAKKSKNYFLRQKLKKKNHFIIEIA